VSAADSVAQVPPGPEPSPDQARELATHVSAAMRDELDQILPHVVQALKRHDGVADLSRRLDRAERRLAERESRPLVAGLRRVLVTARRVDLDPQVHEAIVGELERVLVGAGYAEFGEVGEPFDPTRHEAVETATSPTGSAGGTVVTEVLEPGLETLGEIVVPARVLVGPADTSTTQESHA
jgi:molecular chaperone GrpE